MVNTDITFFFFLGNKCVAVSKVGGPSGPGSPRRRRLLNLNAKEEGTARIHRCNLTSFQHSRFKEEKCMYMF